MASKWKFLALGTVLAGILAFFASCGAKDDKDDGNDNTGTTLSFATDIDPILVASCGGADCHTTGSPYTVYVGSESTLKSKKADVVSRMNLAVGNSARMPKTPDASNKARTISDADKTKIINFLDQ